MNANEVVITPAVVSDPIVTFPDPKRDHEVDVSDEPLKSAHVIVPAVPDAAGDRNNLNDAYVLAGHHPNRINQVRVVPVISRLLLPTTPRSMFSTCVENTLGAHWPPAPKALFKLLVRLVT